MLIGSLHRTGLFVITEDQEQADAFLRGSAEDLIYSDYYRSYEGLRVRGSASSSERDSGGVRVQIRKLRGRRHPELVPSREEARSRGRHQAGAPKRRSHLVNHKGKSRRQVHRIRRRMWQTKWAKELLNAYRRAEDLARKP